MGKMKKTKRETLLMTQAFEYYYSLGDQRSIRKVAEYIGRAERTVQNWSDSFGWRERVAQRDREIAEEIARKNIKDIAESKQNYRKIIKMAVSRFVQSLTETDEDGKPKLKIDSIADLERMIKLDLVLMGEVTEISKVQNENKGAGLTDADRELVRELAQAIIQDIQAANTADNEEVSADGGDRVSIPH